MVTPPIVAAEGMDIKLYESLGDAELDLEVVDVEDGVFTLFDAEGRKLRALAMGSRVIIKAEEDTPGHKSELEDLLRAFLLSIGRATAPSEDLGTLLDRCRQFSFHPPRSWWSAIKDFFLRGRNVDGGAGQPPRVP